MWLYLLILIVFVVSSVKADSHLDPLSDEFIEHLNANQSFWRAGRNFHRDTSLAYLKRLMGSLTDHGAYDLPRKRYKNIRKVLPRNFNAREAWPHCPSLWQIRDQGSCGSCWAVAAASAMTDRVCINSQGRNHFYFSEDDMITCCTNCGAGCDGGLLSRAWMYTELIGTVSGGNYNSHQGCKPYEVPPCKHQYSGNILVPPCTVTKTPQCYKTCQPNYNKNYYDDKRKIGIVYALMSEVDIVLDIYKYGPVTTSMDVFEDFLHYKDGVYVHKSGKHIGSHAIKLLSFGVENGVKYWYAANSWNTEWGDGGFFKILRGQDHCHVESLAVAGEYSKTQQAPDVTTPNLGYKSTKSSVYVVSPVLLLLSANQYSGLIPLENLVEQH